MFLTHWLLCLFIVGTVLSESTVVFIGFHTFQFRLCCSVTDKSSCGCFGSRQSPCVIKNITWWRSVLDRKPRLIGENGRILHFPCEETGDKLVLSEEGAEVYLTEQSPCVLWVLHSETKWDSYSSLDHRYRAKWRQSNRQGHISSQVCSQVVFLSEKGFNVSEFCFCFFHVLMFF